MNTPKPPLPFNVYAVFLILFLALALYLAYSVISPFINTMVLSTVLAVIFAPVHIRMVGWCGGRENLASALTTAIILVALVIPIFIFVFGLVDQGVQAISDLNSWAQKGGLENILKSSKLDPYLEWFNQKFPFLNIELADLRAKFMDLSRTMGQGLLTIGTGLVRNTATMIIQFLLMFFMVFYFMRDGGKMTKRILYLIPLRRAQKVSILDSLIRVTRSVLLGSLLVAALQGMAGGVGLAIIDLPPLFWGTMMGFTSLIPVVGSSVIWIPAATWLMVIGSWKSALFLVLWCLLVVSSIDTFLRPYFLRGAARVSTFYIFLSILGGLNAFGPLGILYGPLILSFVMAMLNIWSEEYITPLLDTEQEDTGTKDPEP